MNAEQKCPRLAVEIAGPGGASRAEVAGVGDVRDVKRRLPMPVYAVADAEVGDDIEVLGEAERH